MNYLSEEEYFKQYQELLGTLTYVRLSRDNQIIVEDDAYYKFVVWKREHAIR